ncbi:unknown [Rickettsia felis URRWXCal2]|uniref:Uncharacterized protein n=1 Tax=Rickettsia felis (strain ATCC VR-1525 / URRWXCal2) TaxID=315456 RepID=Q4UL70_RICFE|nr:unknown [Rickettsia felis URRWXCal2]
MCIIFTTLTILSIAEYITTSSLSSSFNILNVFFAKLRFAFTISTIPSITANLILSSESLSSSFNTLNASFAKLGIAFTISIMLVVTKDLFCNFCTCFNNSSSKSGIILITLINIIFIQLFNSQIFNNNVIVFKLSRTTFSSIVSSNFCNTNSFNCLF